MPGARSDADAAVLARIRELIGLRDALPSRPESYFTLLQLLEDRDVELPIIATVIEAEVSMAAKVLQIANSAYLGLRGRITSIQDAIVYLGIDMIRNLVLVADVFRPAPDAEPRVVRIVAELQRRAVWVAALAGRLVGEDGDLRDRAFSAGLLSQVGILVMATRVPEWSEQVLEPARKHEGRLHELEQHRFGISNADVGAFLLRSWGLPGEIGNAVRYHTHPQRGTSRKLDEGVAVHVAASLVDPVAPGVLRGTGPELQVAFLEEIGLLGHLAGWRAIVAADLAEGAGR